jgi:hypothetical protein
LRPPTLFVFDDAAFLDGVVAVDVDYDVGGSLLGRFRYPWQLFTIQFAVLFIKLIGTDFEVEVAVVHGDGVGGVDGL